MGVIKFDRDFETLFNWDTDDNPTTEQDYQNAVKNWTETEKNIVDTLLWQPTTEYATGNIVKTPSLPSQYVLRCTETGTSGSTEPSYSGAGAGDTVTDGSVEWVIVSLATGNAADVDAGNIGVNAEVDNSEAWASAIGGGAIAEDDGRLVKGDTVYAVTSELASDIATNTEAIEDNTENIATNTENIAQNTTDIDIADKRISNIEKLLQGNLYDYQTDSDSAYTKSVPSGAMPYASLDSVGGKTLVWNQLRTSDNSNNTGDGITTSYNATTGLVTITNDSRTTNYSSGSNQVTLMVNSTIPSGHKFVITTDATDNGIRMMLFSPTTSYNFNTIITAPDTYTGGFLRVTNAYDFVNTHPIGDVYSFHVNIVDLTLMYGSGNEPATYNDFVATFPAFVNTNISHNAGQLLSAGVTEVVSKKADTTEIATYPIPAEIQALEGYGWSAGSVYNYIDYEAKKFVKRVGKYTFTGSETWSDVPNAVFTLAITDALYNVDQYVVCDRYLGMVSGTGSSHTDTQKSCWLQSTSAYKRFYVCDSNYDRTTIGASMVGVEVFYPLATPQEIDISAYLTDDNLIEVEAGGSLTFPNSNGDDYRIDVPSSETYMIDLQSAL